MKRPKLPGTFDCSVNSRGEFHFRLFDAASNALVVDVEITPEQIALALTGRGEQKITFTPYNLARVGHTRENLSIELPDKRAWSDATGAVKFDRDPARKSERLAELHDRMLDAALALIPREKRDGPAWRLSNDGIANQQNDDGWNISLMRFHPPETDEIIPESE